MSNSLQSPVDSQTLITKLNNLLDGINTRLEATSNSSISFALAELNSSFRKFFDTLKDPEFNPVFFLDGDTPRSEVYNNNLKSIYNDLNRFYSELSLLGTSQIKAYNFSQVLIKDVINYSNALASTVLDLNILNGFTRGDAIIAGDDFKNIDNIDTNIGIASTQAETLPNGVGIGLARNGVSSVLENAKIDIIPLAPTDDSNGNINTSPTPGNIGRFYEGNYYAFIGAARPEGGSFNIKYLVDPSTNTVVQDTTTEDFKEIKDSSFFIELGATEDQKKQARLRMIDGNASTFWECEFLFKTPSPIIEDITDSVVVDGDNGVDTSKDLIKTGIVNIDLVEAERIAQQYDTINKDLLLDLIVTFNSLTNINFVAINPVLFGHQAFPDVEDIATANDVDGVFTTVEGWDRIRMPKTITPEANEYLTTSQLGLTLSPSRSNYLGQGIFPFPVRLAKKIKIRIRVKTPVPSIYERTYVLLRKTTNVETTITTTTTKGLF